MSSADSPNSTTQTVLPPGSLGWPVLGETLAFFRDADFATKRHQRYGDCFKTRILGKPTIFVRGTEANRFVLTNENQLFEVSWPPSTRALLGSLSLALQTGGVHQSRRKLLAQAFMPRALSSYIDTMQDITHRYSQRWQQQEDLTWYPELRQYTLDVACKLFTGLDQGSQTALGHAFEVWTEGLFSLPLPLPWTRFGQAKAARSQLLQEVEQIIRQRQARSTDDDDIDDTDALSLLMQAEDEAGERLSIDELKDQVLLLLFAGHETLTSAIATFCLQMALHPNILAKVRAEQAALPDQALTLDSLKQMTYLEQVLKEVLRFVPPVGGGFRRVLQTCEFEGYRIPADWNVLYQIGATHQDQALYPHAEQFDPDRFSRTEYSQKYGYIPFGGGIRECVGKEFARLEMKIFAALLVRDYDWTLQPDQSLDLVTIPTPRPKDGLKVNFYHR